MIGKRKLTRAILCLLLVALLAGAPLVSADTGPDYTGIYHYFQTQGPWHDGESGGGAEQTGFTPFADTLWAAALAGSEGENFALSPLTLYQALAMVAETTDGDAREEILALLGADNLTDLRANGSALYAGSSMQTPYGRSAMANSLWLSEAMAFNQNTIDGITTHYHADAFTVPFGTAETDGRITDWLTAATGGILDGMDQNTAADDVMVLISALYFYDEWAYAFDAQENTTGPFHLADGGTVEAEYMNGVFDSHSFFVGETYTGTGLAMKGGSELYLVLPDEGESVQALLEGGLLSDIGENATEYFGEVTVHVPKFSAASELDMTDTLRDLGLTTLLSDDADFSPLTADPDVSLSRVLHSARVSIDEQGVEAASYTKIDYVGSAPPQDSLELTLDRPFLFYITGPDGLPRFCGVVGNPTGD